MQHLADEWLTSVVVWKKDSNPLWLQHADGDLTPLTTEVIHLSKLNQAIGVTAYRWE